MSRIGKLPISIPEGVNISLDGQKIMVSGPKGSLERDLPKNISVEIKEGKLKVLTKDGRNQTRALHGTIRSHLANMVKGVTQGWSKALEVVGTGFRAETDGKVLSLNVGYSHPVKIDAPKGITFQVNKLDIIVEGIDKELVGLVASRIRRIRPPEPYKGKGIRYKDEVVRRKPGKAAKTVGASAG